MKTAIRGLLRLACVTVLMLLAGCETAPVNEGGIQPMVNTTGSDSDARNRARIHTELAAGYFSLGNLGVALEEVNIARQSDDSYAPAYGVAGLVFAALKDDTRAEEQFRKALRLSPADPDINNNFGSFLCQRKREDEGIRHLLAAVRNPLYKTPDRSYANAGVCARRKGDMVEARAHFQRALQYQPGQALALYQLADMAYAENNFAAAQGYLQRFARAAPANAEVLWLAIRVERRLGNSVNESSYTQQLRKNFPNSAEAAALESGRFE
jgi:type IV pilus assembly protein PilF